MKRSDTKSDVVVKDKSNNALYDLQNGSGSALLAIVKARKAAKGGK
jgi:hypothetical protein